MGSLYFAPSSVAAAPHAGRGSATPPDPPPPRTRPSPTLGDAPRARGVPPRPGCSSRPVCPSSVLHPGPVTRVERPPPRPATSLPFCIQHDSTFCV
ncbi:hypothetical protein KC19_2G115800 [Ceratodon purpureus]|uniref:Uncharacterized protein n=1 Tax=Ceratodon purpureus TaxID=3225 RepID=A0A8T0IUF3_CERPU|nr:hypothetical protein KC19_2G115800 [Ceratodon purpureus]